MKPTTILYIVLALIIGFGVGYLMFRGAPPAGLSSGVEQAPVLKSNWDNQAITTWQAAVRGELVARDEDSFTLRSGEKTITLPLAQGTIFYDSRDPAKPLDFTAVPFSTAIKGFVNIDREKGIFTWGTYSVQFE